MKPKKCAKCHGDLEEVRGINKIFLNRYIISDARMKVCKRCGEEYISDKEYERIRQKIADIESKKKIPEVSEVLAKAKFFVL